MVERTACRASIGAWLRGFGVSGFQSGLGFRFWGQGSGLQAPVAPWPGSRASAPGSRLRAPGLRGSRACPGSRAQGSAPGSWLRLPGSRLWPPAPGLRGSGLCLRLGAPGLKAQGSRAQALPGALVASGGLQGSWLRLWGLQALATGPRALWPLPGLSAPWLWLRLGALAQGFGLRASGFRGFRVSAQVSGFRVSGDAGQGFIPSGSVSKSDRYRLWWTLWTLLILWTIHLPLLSHEGMGVALRWAFLRLGL